MDDQEEEEAKKNTKCYLRSKDGDFHEFRFELTPETLQFVLIARNGLEQRRCDLSQQVKNLQPIITYAKPQERNG